MAYFLGKENTGDLASILSGAYNASTAKSSIPATAAEPTTPLNKTTQDRSRGACESECVDQKGFQRGTQAYERCMDICMSGEGDGTCRQNFACTSTDDCGGKPCVNGKCDCEETLNCKEGAPCTNSQQCYGKPCVNGKCVCAGTECDATHPCPTGKVCENGNCVASKACSATVPCPTGETCVNGVCQKPDTSCPEGMGLITHDGCPCNAIYNTKTGKCADGYQFVKRPNNGVRADWAKEIEPVAGAIGTCECKAWITKPNKSNLGEYKYPAEMQSLMDLLLSRGKDFLGLTPGYSQEAQDKMFGQNFENVRDTQKSTGQTIQNTLQRQGMLGTGTEAGLMNENAWNAEQNVADLARDLFVKNEEKKKSDLLDYTTAAQSILGSGTSYESLLESINAARRGEGSASLQALLAWLLANYG